MEDRAPEIRSKPPCSRADAEAVLSRLRQEGHTAYFAGGCVRDLLLGLEPKDWDVATDAPPDRVRRLFSRTQAVGAAFGVILVRQGDSIVEVATFRSEGEYLDGRRPSKVRFSTAQEDAARRDFTINGLFLDPLNDDRVIDFVGGLEDLKARRLRAIGDPGQRFAEDHLRLLRAVRFAARFGLEIEVATAAAMERDAPLLKQISPERIADELRLMLTPPTRTDAWQLLWRFGLVEVVFRFLMHEGTETRRHEGGGAGEERPRDESTKRRRDPGGSRRRFDFSLVPAKSIFLATAPGAAISFGLALAAGSICVIWQQMRMSGDIRPHLERAGAKQIGRAMRHALKLSNDELEELTGTLEGLGPLLADREPRVAMMKRFLARPTAALSRKLMDALHAVGICGWRIAALRPRLDELEQEDFAPPPLITGDDLTAAGLSPGPAFKKILNDVYDAQLEGRVGTRQEAMKMAMEMTRPPHPES